MESGYICPDEKGTQICNEILKMQSDDSFQVDMEPLTNKDLTYNSRFHLQRSLSRTGEEKKSSNPSVDNVRFATSSPKASSIKPVSIGANEAKSYHQISIITTTTTTDATETPTRSRVIGKRSNSFKQTSIINPRRILFLFATIPEKKCPIPLGILGTDGMHSYSWAWMGTRIRMDNGDPWRGWELAKGQAWEPSYSYISPSP